MKLQLAIMTAVILSSATSAFAFGKAPINSNFQGDWKAKGSCDNVQFFMREAKIVVTSPQEMHVTYFDAKGNELDGWSVNVDKPLPDEGVSSSLDYDITPNSVSAKYTVSTGIFQDTVSTTVQEAELIDQNTLRLTLKETERYPDGSTNPNLENGTCELTR